MQQPSDGARRSNGCPGWSPGRCGQARGSSLGLRRNPSRRAFDVWAKSGAACSKPDTTARRGLPAVALIDQLFVGNYRYKAAQVKTLGWSSDVRPHRRFSPDYVRSRDQATRPRAKLGPLSPRCKPRGISDPVWAAKTTRPTPAGHLRDPPLPDDIASTGRASSPAPPEESAATASAIATRNPYGVPLWTREQGGPAAHYGIPRRCPKS